MLFTTFPKKYILNKVLFAQIFKCNLKSISVFIDRFAVEIAVEVVDHEIAIV